MGYDVINPATQELLLALEDMSDAEVDRIVMRARGVFKSGAWSAQPVAARQQVLHQIADTIDAHAAELAALETSNVGIPIAQTTAAHVTRAALNFRFFSDYIGQEEGQLYEQNPDYLTFVRREATGVAALIAPWNAPLALGAMKIAAAIAFGNSAIIKPSEQAPLTLTRLVEILATTDLPRDVVQLVNGRGATAGAALVSHPGVDRISFTGGTQTGRVIMRAAAQMLTPVTMELGGKSANVIFADADFDRALDGALTSIYAGNGQQCLAGSRILVEESIAPRFIDAFVDRAEKITVGDPMDGAFQMGPVASAAQYARIQSFLKGALADGARYLTGGDRPAGLDKGYFLRPVAIQTDDPSATVCQDEIFGPFATFLTFKTEEEAYKLANSTSFGLVSYVWSQDMARVMRAQDALKAGVVWVNTPMTRELRAPFGGIKESGIGAEGGHACAAFYGQQKTVSLPLTAFPLPKFGA
ncbi:MAG: aldehyde dehydrogenase family protein [Pseudomonadota bacterium]